MKTHLELREGKSAKFWEIEVSGRSYVVRYGRIGTKGQSKTKELASDEEALAAAKKLVAQKRKKGYAHVGDGSNGPVSSAVEVLRDELRALVPKVFEAEVAFARANDVDHDATFEESVRPPATDAQIAHLEEQLGRALPPSYRAFLSLWNGATFGFGGGAELLGTEDHASEHIKSWREDKRVLFVEFEEENPFNHDPIPLVLGDSRSLILLEPPVRADGEMDVVVYYLTEEEDRYPDLLTFFQSQLEELAEDT